MGDHTMKWYNTKLDKLPKHKQEVLVSSKGVNYVALYDEPMKCFKVQEKSKEKKFRVDDEQLYWTEYKRPGEK